MQNIIKKLIVLTPLIAFFPLANAVANESQSNVETVSNNIETEIDISAQNDGLAEVAINKNGKIIELELPKEILKDQKKLKAAIASLDEESQAVVLEALANVGDLHKNKTQEKVVVKEVLIVKDKATSEKIEWVDENGANEKQMVIEVDQSDATTMTKDKHVFISADDQKEGYTKAVLHMLKSGSFTKEQLVEIQNALDAKKKQ